jgi:glycerol-3-phosphate acyltransferase PlsX
MRIAIDAMGGDQAPAQVLKGAVRALALLEPGDELILVGPEEILRQHLRDEHAADDARLRIENATQVIAMDDSPVEAVRSKRDSSLVRMVKLGAAGQADALISAGNTGALVAAGVLMLKPLKGVERPGIAVTIPTAAGPVMLCDAGANTQPKASHLYQYAVMASLYMQAIHAVERPRVAVLNVGVEEEKGTPLVKESRQLIEADKRLNFTGYIEGRDLFRCAADVVVTDGFTGNVVLKVTEGAMAGLLKTIQKEIAAEPAALRQQFAGPLERVGRQYDHEEAGGALLLGVSGTFVKVHGSGGQRAIMNAVRVAKNAGRLDIQRRIVDHLAV